MFYLQYKFTEAMTYSVKLSQSPSNLQSYQLILLDEQRQPIGHALGEFRQYDVWYNGQPYFFLTDLVITDQHHRQQGFGSQLLKAVESFARKEGAYWVRGQLGAKAIEYTDASTDERALRTFWGKNGYGIKREIYDNSIRFWKPLQHAATSQSSAVV